MKPSSLLIVVAGIALAGTALAEWTRLPNTETNLNLANRVLLGTQVKSSAGINNPQALISEVASEASSLTTGKSEVVIEFGEQQIVEATSFVNDGAAGRLTISGSIDQSDWIGLAQVAFDGTQRQVAAQFAGVQAKYVRLSFEVTAASEIRSLRISGPSTSNDYKAVAVKEAQPVDVNLASGSLGARPIYMSPTPVNAGDGSQTSFKFPKSKDRYRTIVYDLGNLRTIKKFNAAYSRVPTRLEVFAFEQLPEKTDWRGKLTLDPAIFDTNKPIASGEDARGLGNIQVLPQQPVKAQYVALRFEPNYHKRAVAGLAPDWDAMAFSAAVPFGNLLSEFGVFDGGMFTQGADGGDEFTVFDASVGGSVPLVVISKAAIAKVQAQLAAQGLPATEADAVNSILQAIGLTPLGTGASGQSTSQVADPQAPVNLAGLSALGLSPYRGTGGANPQDPFTTTVPTTTTTTTGNAGGATGPIVIVTTEQAAQQSTQQTVPPTTN